jgi:hypothetical protein
MAYATCMLTANSIVIFSAHGTFDTHACIRIYIETYELFPPHALFVCCDYVVHFREAMSLPLNNKSLGRIVQYLRKMR